MELDMPAISPRSGERRRTLRFAMHCSILLHPHASDRRILAETANVSAGGVYFASKVALPPDEPVEYVLTFPPELTHAPSPWRVRFYGSVVRVEAKSAEEGIYGLALQTTKHRYLSPEEPDGFCSFEPDRTVSRKTAS
jgi:hypothetical protein